MNSAEARQKSPKMTKRNKEETMKDLLNDNRKVVHYETTKHNNVNVSDTKIQDADFATIELKYSLPYIPNEYNSWHKNKQKAWKLIPSCPSLFYFFYLAPGLHEASYPPQEQEFIDSLKVYPPQLNGWGLFSLHLPGYTGKQCYDYYMTLLSEKKVSGKYKTLPIFQKIDIPNYYTSFLNACKSYTLTLKEEHSHHKCPAYNRHNDNHHNNKHKVVKEEEEEEDDDDELLFESKKNKTKKNHRKSKSINNIKKNKKAKNYIYLDDDSQEEELPLFEEDTESESFSITTDDNSHEEEESSDDDDSVIKLVRKNPKKNINSQDSKNTTPKSKCRSSKINNTPSSIKTIDSSPQSSISICNEVELSPFQTPTSSIISVKTTPNNTGNDDELNESVNSTPKIETPETVRKSDDSSLSPPSVKRSNIEKSSYYKNSNNCVGAEERNLILDSPINDDSIQIGNVDVLEKNEIIDIPIKEILEVDSNNKREILTKESEKFSDIKNSIKTIVLKKRKLENITEGYCNKKQKNLISLLSREYSILPEVDIPLADENKVPYEFQLIKYHCEIEFRRLTQIILNSIDLLRREYYNAINQSDKMKLDKMYKFVIDELKYLENKYDEGIIDIQRRYNAEYDVIKSIINNKEFNDENLFCNKFINPFYM